MSKRREGFEKLVDKDKKYSLKDAVSLLSDYAGKYKAKFDETVEVVFALGVDPRHSDQMVRGVVQMPNGLGKEIKVAVITNADRLDEAKKAGADIVGAEDFVDEIKKGKVSFDVCIATPDMMPKVGVLGKVLGPKGLMPNPKLGTVSANIAEAVSKSKAGQVEYKVEKAGLVHAGVGKLSFASDKLLENVKVLYDAVVAAKPSAAKGVYMKSMFVTTSMGMSIRLDLSNVLG